MIKSLLTTAVACLLAVPFTVSSFHNRMIEPKIMEDRVETYENLYVDVGANSDWFYSFMSDVEVHYNENNMEYLYIHDPTLLAFQVSSAHYGGVWVLDLDKGTQILTDLTETDKTLKEIGNTALSEKIENMIDTMENSGPFTQAST